MDYSIRELRQNESKVLNTFLYEAIFIPERVPIPPKEIINQPELQCMLKILVRIKETCVWLLKPIMKLLVQYGVVL